MTSDAITACMDMTFADAICDLALKSGMDESEARDAILNSGAYDALFDEETGLWASGPDAFIDFYERLVGRAGELEMPSAFA